MEDDEFHKCMSRYDVAYSNLFSDGLHENEKMYRYIGTLMV